MTQSILHTESQAKHALLVTLLAGSSTYRFCRWDNDLTVDGDDFTAMACLSYDADALGGGLDQEKFTLTLDAEVEPLPSLLSPYIHAPVTALIQEVAPGTDASLRNVFKGTFGSIKQNPQGNRNIANVEVLGLKRRLHESVVGLPALTTCVNSLGDFRCQKDISGETLTGTVSTVRRLYDNHIEVTLSGSPVMQNAKWRRGYVDLDGARSVIRQILDAGTNPNPTVGILLRDFAPDAWVGESITLTPGCDGNASTCTTVWDNIEHFNGFGFAMPTRNPVFEQ